MVVSRAMTAPTESLPPKVSLDRQVRFWYHETPLRLRSWWRRHWWPARISQLDRERADWKRWYEDVDTQIGALANFIMHEVPGEPSQSEGAIECAIRLLRDQRNQLAKLRLFVPVLLGRRAYRDIIKALDWNRVLLEAQGRHLLHFTPEQSEAIKADDLHPLCGQCIRDVLLFEEDWTGIS